jgi:hypothetical protein
MSRQRASHRKRPAHNPPQRMVIPVQEIEAIVEQSGARPLTETEQATLKAAVDTLARITAELETKETTLARLRRILFGAPTERTAHVLGEGKKGETPPADTPTRPSAEGGDEQAAGQAPSDTTSPEPGEPSPRRSAPGTEGTGRPIIRERRILPYRMRRYGTAIRVPSPGVPVGCMGNEESPRSWFASPASRHCSRRSTNSNGCVAACVAPCLPPSPRQASARPSTTTPPQR